MSGRIYRPIFDQISTSSYLPHGKSFTIGGKVKLYKSYRLNANAVFLNNPLSTEGTYMEGVNLSIIRGSNINPVRFKDLTELYLDEDYLSEESEFKVIHVFKAIKGLIDERGEAYANLLNEFQENLRKMDGTPMLEAELTSACSWLDLYQILVNTGVELNSSEINSFISTNSVDINILPKKDLYPLVRVDVYNYKQ